MLREHTSESEAQVEVSRFGSNQDEGNCAGDGLMDGLCMV